MTPGDQRLCCAISNALQAYHLVAERTATPGPRPSTVRRIVQFLAGLR